MNRQQTIALAVLALLPLVMGAGSPSVSRPPAPAAEAAYIRYYNDGVKADKAGDYPRSVELYRRALREKPDFADAHNNLGFALRKIGDGYAKQAMAEYQAALKTAPAHAGALEYEGELYIQTGELRKAQENYQRLLKVSPDEAAKLKAKLDRVVAEAKGL